MLGLEEAVELLLVDLDLEVAQSRSTSCGYSISSIVPGAQKSGSYSSRKCSVSSGRSSWPIAASPARWPAATSSGE
jgi:hypothetical protein